MVYTPEWPAVKRIDAQIKGIEAELAKAPTEIVSSMKRRYEAAVARQNSLARAYEQQKAPTPNRSDTIDLIPSVITGNK